MTYRMSKADLKRANRRDDTSAAPKSKTDRVKDAASAVRVGARNAAKSLKRKAGAALGKLASKLSEEGGELDSFDTVIAYLIDEEIASDFDEATAMMSKLSAETVSKIHESQMTYITEISAQLTAASMKADEVARKGKKFLVTKRLLPRKYNKHHASTKVLDLVEQGKNGEGRILMAKDKKGKGSGTKDACYHKVSHATQLARSLLHTHLVLW